MENLKRKWLFIMIFSLIVFVRLWKVPNFFIFTFSEEWQGTLAWEQIKNFHPIWIGVSQANIHYYLGPGFIYLNYFLFLIGKGNVAVLAYSSALLGLSTVLCLFYVVKNLFSKRVAIIACIIYGFSTLINYYDRRFWNPSFIPLFTLLFIYSLIKAKQNTRWFILTAALIGVSFHSHLLLLLFVIPTIYCIIKYFRKIRWTTWLAMIAVYLILTSPLIIFDLNHNFDNFLVPFRLIFGGEQNELESISIGNVMNHAKTLLSTLGRIWFLTLHTNLQDVALETNTTKIAGNVFLSILSIISLIWFFLKNRKPGYGILFTSLTLYVLAFLVYPSYNPEYYLMSFITLMTIVIAYWLNTMPKFISYPLITLFIIANILTVITTTEDYGLTMRVNLIKKTMPVLQGQSFYLETIGPLDNPQYAYAGWRLLYKIYGKTPAQSSIDSVLGWIYPDEISNTKPRLKLVVSQDMIPKFNQRQFYTFQSGVYRAYIFNNE